MPLRPGHTPLPKHFACGNGRWLQEGIIHEVHPLLRHFLQSKFLRCYQMQHVCRVFEGHTAYKAHLRTSNSVYIVPLQYTFVLWLIHKNHYDSRNIQTQHHIPKSSTSITTESYSCAWIIIKHSGYPSQIQIWPPSTNKIGKFFRKQKTSQLFRLHVKPWIATNV